MVGLRSEPSPPELHSLHGAVRDQLACGPHIAVQDEGSLAARVYVCGPETPRPLPGQSDSRPKLHPDDLSHALGITPTGSETAISELMSRWIRARPWQFESNSLEHIELNSFVLEDHLAWILDYLEPVRDRLIMFIAKHQLRGGLVIYVCDTGDFSNILFDNATVRHISAFRLPLLIRASFGPIDD